MGDQDLGLSFGAVADTYARVRPPYPEVVLDRADDALGLTRGATVLDLGAGTGTLTRGLAGRYEHVVAVEPDERMRAVHGGAATRNPPWDDAFESSPFEPLQSEFFESALVADADALLELFATTSSIAALPVDERAALVRDVRAQLEGPYRLPIRHELTWTRLA